MREPRPASPIRDTRALAGDPAVLLADEPTGNLDSANGEAVMGFLSELHAAGSTIVMVTHDRRFNRYATRIIGVLDGRVVPEHVAAAIRNEGVQPKLFSRAELA
jgi:putative ABC transport system ATP-binding protein